ncbi:metal ABC transporter substrate-binding protein [Thermofilum pendens]|uniref:Periplasmic solute binding protein n=1 Tax=Thermofilum pendens (strain DSM 2475 / Hrk 5) TaxID=368408 RepID=A1RWF1_THEPD|nr:zinc ABC transporter substrate-binding protein [Thermofilum pendens]ABL77531.1 periplasmic solute binding protein [Thermofilum pendens Hrk 5]
MSRRSLALVAVVVLVALGIGYLLLSPGLSPQAPRAGGLKIVVTFYSLKGDIEYLLCQGDEVIPVTPQGVDPHEYQLTPSDVARIREGSLIVSTAHAPFEQKIKQLVETGELKSRLIEIPRIPGIKLLVNPSTGTLNYHWPIYDPNNYIAYINYTAHVMASLRPECASTYLSKASGLIANITSIERSAPRLNLVAVGSSPVVQYSVEWMGINVSYLLIKEADLPATPQDIATIEDAMARGAINVVVISKGLETTSAGKTLVDLASKYGKPVLYVPSPISSESTYEKILVVVKEVEKVLQKG